MACIATWSFGLQAVEGAAVELEGGVDCVEALEKGVNGKSLSVVLTDCVDIKFAESCCFARDHSTRLGIA